MSPAEVIEIIIYDAPTSRPAGCDCGCDHHGHEAGHSHGSGSVEAFDKISMAMQTRALALTLEREFPGRVRVEYIDVLSNPRGPALPQTKLMASPDYPPPLVYINGRGRFAGALPVERLREEVQALLTAPNS